MSNVWAVGQIVIVAAVALVVAAVLFVRATRRA